MKPAINNKTLLTVLACLSFAFSTPGQQDPSEVTAAFNEYKKHSLRERIFVHTDKDLYVAGEIVWFKLYVTNADNNRPIDLSKVSYIEIFSADQKPILQTKVVLKDGSGNGSLYLPGSVNSGVYRFRAYTHWMKNFSAEYYFEKPITIVNTLKTLPVQPVESAQYDLQFFPEGGSLVQNLQSQVAFKLADHTGRGINDKGFIVRNNRDTIAEFQPLKVGIGRFNFTPEPGNFYKAVVKLPGLTLIKDLPEALEEGYVLKVKDSSGSQIGLTISTTFKAPGFVYVFIHKRHHPEVFEKVFIRDGIVEFRVDRNKLAEGISYITVFDKDVLPVCERLIFIQPKQRLILGGNTDKDQYGSRQQVKMTITSTDDLGRGVPADLSISVHRSDAFDPSQSFSIDTYRWLASDLKGTIESPAYYFTGKGDEADEATDNLMLTQGWRSFVWEDILRRNKPRHSFLPEYRGHIIYARVTDKITKRPSPGILAYLSVPGPRIQLYPSVSDSNGIVRFYTSDLLGPNEIVLQAGGSRDNSYNLDIMNPFSDKLSERKLPAFHLPENIKSLLTDYSISMQVQNNFKSTQLKQVYTPSIDSSAFFGDPDKKYKLDDYTRFSTMEEVLREYVGEVLVRRQKEDFRLIMSDGANRIFLDDPLTLFNGVPVFDPNKIIRYDPLKVKEIDIIKSKYFFGPSVSNGIVSLITYEPDPSMFSDLNALIMEYEGMQYQRQFYSPVYQSEQQVSSPMPDFRNVLCWYPEISTGAQGKTEITFFTSDMKGKYVAVLQGVNSDGGVAAKTIFFEVK